MAELIAALLMLGIVDLAAGTFAGREAWATAGWILLGVGLLAEVARLIVRRFA